MQSISFRPRDEKPYILPYFNQPMTANTLKISQVALGFFSTLSATASFCSPSHLLWVSVGAFTIFSASLTASCFIIKKAPSLPLAALQTVEEKLQGEMYLLSGIDREGTPQDCPDETFKTFVEHLQTEGKLSHILNGFSKYDILSCECYGCKPLTPLQHWSKRGDLYKVRLLIEKGAADQCIGKHATTSALFESLLEGHKDVVEYLLSVGAQSYLTLNEKDPLKSFLPKLVYEYCDRRTFKISHQTSLKTFLSHFQSYAPKNLAYQLNIPIAERENSETYVKNYYREFEGKKDLLNCLSAYKKNDQVFAPEQLSENPFTLEEIGQQKENI